MLALLVIGATAAAALLGAASVRLRSLTATLLVAYLAFVADVGLTTLVLSPFHAVTRGGLAVAEGVVLAGAIAAWWLRGRPGLPLDAARAAVRTVLSDIPTAVFLCAVLVLLAYELALGLMVPPNTWDSLAYHLPRAAAWAQHHGVEWIPNAPTLRMNAFQPLAEQELFFLFVATGSGVLYALPQFLAELAILVAVYGGARRLGYGIRPSACAALLFACFALVALEATTAQNDLVAASFPAVAVCLLLGEGLLEPALAGVAAGFGVGVKLTTALALPVLVWLALTRGRRVLAAAVAGGLLGLVALGGWSYVLNDVHSGAFLGAGTGALEDRGSPSYPGSVKNAFLLMYGTMDLSVLSDRLIHLLALAGLVVALAIALLTRRAGLRGLTRAGAAALPFVAPLLVVGGAGALAFVARRWGFPLRGSGGAITAFDEVLNAQYTRISNEDWNAFGPLGIVALLGASTFSIGAYAARRVDVRHAVLATALPVSLVLMALETTWNPFLVRFFLVPAAVSAPLLAVLFRDRLTTAAYLAVGTLTAALTIVQVQSKPLGGHEGLGRPWQLTQSTALFTNSRPEYAHAVSAYDALVPPHACVGAVFNDFDPSYLLYRPRLRHRVIYLSPDRTLVQAIGKGLFYVVLTSGEHAAAETQLKDAGWRIRPLGEVWELASAPHAGAGTC